MFWCFKANVVNQFVYSISDDHCCIGTKMGPLRLDLKIRKDYKEESIVYIIGLRQNILRNLSY